MKHLILIAFSFCMLSTRAQNISSFTVQTNCPILITAPTDSALVFGAASVTDDTISSYIWKQVSGPSTAVFANAAASQSAVRKLIPGIYVFSLTVTTKRGSIQTILGDQVTVLPAPAPPRKIVKVTYQLIGGTWIAAYMYDDGSTQ